MSFPGGVASDFSLVTATGVLQPRAIYHSNRLVRRILIRSLRTLADAWLVCYPSFSSTESYSQAPSTSHTVFNSSRPADSNEALADPIRPLAVELPQLLVSFPGRVATDFTLVTATSVLQPRTIYHSNLLVCRILMRPLRTLAEAWLVRYLFLSSTGCYSQAPATSHTAFNLPRLAESNEALVDSIQPLAVELTQPFVSFPGGAATDFTLVTATGVLQPRAVYHSNGLVRRILIRPLRTLADTWLVRYLSFLSTGCYSHAPAMSHTAFDSPRPADSNETLADSIRPLAVELTQLLVSSMGGVATDFILVTATGVLQPRAIYHSNRLLHRILMRSVRTLADAWLVRYLSFSSTGCYSHAPAMSNIPIESSRPADSNETLADSIRRLAVELPQLLVSFPGKVATDFTLVTATGVLQPRTIYHSNRLVRRILMRPLRTLADAWLVRYLSFSSTGCYSHAPAMSNIPIDSPCPADSNETLADSI